jgi:uncharacterized membrane protein YdjX (TVP38/TMEM64 family)
MGSRSKLIALLIILVIAAVVLLLYTDITAWITNWNPEQVLKLANDNIPLLLLITLLLMIIQSMLSFFPIILLVTINFSLFGIFYGYLWSLISSVIGAVVAFLIVRHGVQSYFIKKINQNMIEKIERNGFSFVFMMRIFPLLPTSLINIGVGLSTVKINKFINGTLLGNMIYFFVLALIPLGLISKNADIYLYAFVAVVIVTGIVIWLYRSKQKRKQQQQKRKQQQQKVHEL